MLKQQKKAKATADVVKLIGESGSVYLCINDSKKKKKKKVIMNMMKVIVWFSAIR